MTMDSSKPFAKHPLVYEGEEMEESWKPIIAPGVEGAYEASSLGRVRGVDRVVWSSRGQGFSCAIRGCIIQQWVDHKGYAQVRFRLSSVRKKFFVHRLVAEAFLGPLPEGYHTHHIDGDSTNNRIDNLCYIHHSMHLHLHSRGEKAFKGVLTASQVQEIRAQIRQGAQIKDLAEQYGVGRHSISHIKFGRTWAWLDEDTNGNA